MYQNLKEKIQFINISSEDLTLFEWKPPRSFKSYILDLNIIRKNKISEIFFHHDKGNMKIVHIRKDNLIYSIGANNEIQFQVLEAILEYIEKKFHKTYDINVILTYENTSASIFKPFKKNVDKVINNLKDLNLVKEVNVSCKVCKKILKLYIKKSIIKDAISFPIPVVYNHKGHAIVCYIDQNFIVRGVELVNITG
ncbi:MAG: hypothetical protein ACFFAN_03125 [Promethearchaeota archaeon]